MWTLWKNKHPCPSIRKWFSSLSINAPMTWFPNFSSYLLIHRISVPFQIEFIWTINDCEDGDSVIGAEMISCPTQPIDACVRYPWRPTAMSSILLKNFLPKRWQIGGGRSRYLVWGDIMIDARSRRRPFSDFCSSYVNSCLLCFISSSSNLSVLLNLIFSIPCIAINFRLHYLHTLQVFWCQCLVNIKLKRIILIAVYTLK